MSRSATASDPDRQRLAALVRGHAIIPRSYFAPEAALLLTKWPAYRFMSPWRATLEFIKAYRDAYKDCLARHSDFEYAQRANPLARLDLTANNKRLTQFCVARQHADERFIPYGEYLGFAFDFAMRRKRARLPQANQLRPSGDDQTQAWEIEFAKFWTADRINNELSRMEAMAQFVVGDGIELPAQTSYRAALVALAQEEDIRLSGVIGTHVVVRRHVAAEDFAAIFGDDVVESTIASAEHDVQQGWRTIAVYDALHKAERWQACCGVLGVDHERPAPCGDCGQADTCSKLRTLVERELMRTHGSLDPLLDEQRRKQREDTARCRARKKAAAAATATGTAFAPA